MESDQTSEAGQTIESGQTLRANGQASRRTRRWWYAGVLLAVLVLGGRAFLRVGSWLVVQDEPEPSAAIVVLSGEVPYRAMEGADLYNQGWAPEVWLTRDSDRRREEAVGALGIELLIDADDNRNILEAMGVPADAIRVLPGIVASTADEVRLISRTLSETGGERVIIVTSPFHTRRARALWRGLVGDTPGALLQPSRRDPYSASRWWRRTDDIWAVAKEVLGLLNAWMGSRVQPR